MSDAPDSRAVHSTERYRAFPDTLRLPLGDNLELLYAPLTRGARTQPALCARMLQSCRQFATLDEHAQRLTRELKLVPGQARQIREQLGILLGAGLLVSQEELLARCSRTAGRPVPPSVAVLGVPTRDRPESLRHCLTSYADNARRHGRGVDVVVVDDSRAEANRDANRLFLEQLRDQFGLATFYAGPEERAHYAEALARQAGAAPEVARFALLNEERCPIATGASRNALLLHSAGDLLLQVDDDTVCRLMHAPEARRGLAFSSRYDPTEFWFSTEASTGREEDADFIGLHEQLLGKSPGDATGRSPEAPEMEDCAARFFRELDYADARVRATAVGVAGDSGMGAAVHFLSLDAASRARLLRSEQGYRAVLTGHQVQRAVTRATIGDASLCMGLNLGLDNRTLLPPFFPVQRNQDGIFGALLKSCVGGSYFGFLPRLLQHTPPSPRVAGAGSLWQSLATPTTGQIILALTWTLAPGPNRTDAGRGLRDAGRVLAEWGAAPPADFAEWARGQVWQFMSRLAQHLTAELQRHGNQPDFWANDVRQALALLREGVTRPDYAVPADLVEAFGAGEAARLVQRLVLKFGRLLQDWPALVEAAKELRGRGVQLVERV